MDNDRFSNDQFSPNGVELKVHDNKVSTDLTYQLLVQLLMNHRHCLGFWWPTPFDPPTVFSTSIVPVAGMRSTTSYKATCTWRLTQHAITVSKV